MPDQLVIPLTINDNATPTNLKLDMSARNNVFVPWIRVNLTFDEDADFSSGDVTIAQE